MLNIHNTLITNCRDYNRGMLYKNDTLRHLPLPEGYYDGSKYYASITDYLGSVRVVLKNNASAYNKVTEVVEINHFDPWGVEFGMSGNPAGIQDYKHQGKERLNLCGTSVHDHGARMVFNAASPWLSMDPLMEKFYDLSPYVFCANNPIKYTDSDGRSPKDRVQSAYNKIGIKYKQEGNTKLRTENTKEALAYMDCSEFVSRVLADDGITNSVEHRNASALKEFLGDKDMFIHSITPEVGDFALWEGHAGIVTDVNENNAIKLTHARGVNKLSGENPNFIKPEKYSTTGFVGYYRPKNETPDGKVTPNSGSKVASDKIPAVNTLYGATPLKVTIIESTRIVSSPTYGVIKEVVQSIQTSQ